MQPRGHLYRYTPFHLYLLSNNDIALPNKGTKLFEG